MTQETDNEKWKKTAKMSRVGEFVKWKSIGILIHYFVGQKDTKELQKLI